MQAWLYRQLVPEARTSGISLLNLFIVGLVLLSFLFLALETEPVLNQEPAWARLFAVFNITVVSIFAVEYAARIWVAGIDPQYRGLGGRMKYVTQFYPIADLLAFLPELILMLVGGGGALLVLRVLRLARLVKIARFIPAFDALGRGVAAVELAAPDEPRGGADAGLCVGGAAVFRRRGSAGTIRKSSPRSRVPSGGRSPHLPRWAMGMFIRSRRSGVSSRRSSRLQVSGLWPCRRVCLPAPSRMN